MAHTEKCRGCMYENECSFINCRKDEIKDEIKKKREKENEILKYLGKLKETADDLYKYGCEPEDLIIYRMRTYIQGIEELCR